ncbi:DUF5357 family protein [Phormidium sp. CCY1219]|uniref:DUF5357 family protein n=1 Tax=Phormidium sp. CCY1219 TaxID=2886104 RepID=UPI002D1F5C72|nr:DUF5357 family protein [Phormidium sp. CCY1219]MEB3827479.1 DUF5357 domain-containing protein [Phormidium sp. CCY1219]
MIKWIVKLIEKLKPTQPFSWETCVLLSIFSWLVSFFSLLQVPPALYAYELTNNAAWVFFIVGTTWWQAEKPWKILGINLGPWAIGLLLTILFFEYLPDRWFIQIGIWSWPILAAAIAALPKVLPKMKLTAPPVEVRPQLVRLLFTNLLVSCWLQFLLLINSGIADYPTLLQSGDFNQSSFAIRVGRLEEIPARGESILNSMEAFIRSQVEGEQWGKVELLVSKWETQNKELENQVKTRLSPLPENQWWNLTEIIVQTQGGYLIQLFATWERSPSDNPPLKWKKNCQIERNLAQPTPGSAELPPIAVGRGSLQCQPAIRIRSENP